MKPLLDTAGWTLIHFAWQGCAIGMLAAVALRIVDRRTANVRYAVACAGLLLMVAAPIATFRALRAEVPVDWSARLQPGGATLDIPASADGGLRSGRVQPAESSPLFWPFAAPLQRFERAVPVLTLAWLAGVALLLGRMAGGWWRVRHLHRAAFAASASPWQTACRRIAFRLGLPAAAHVVESALVDVPTVVGWIRPAILLPVAALTVLSPAQVEAILAHELAHIRRHDYAVNLLQTFAETLLFYHPAVWWISGRIRAEREHCCDEIAVRTCGDPIEYARALTELEAWRLTAAPLTVAATGGPLTDRVRRILRGPAPDDSQSVSAFAMFVVALLLAIGTVGAASQTSAPPAPAAPPSASVAPPAPSSTDWSMRWHDGDTRQDVTLHGSITFTDDLTDVTALSDGGYLKIRDWRLLIPYTVEVRSSGGRLTHEYFVAGFPRPWNEEARAFLTSTLPPLVRESAIGADSRVRSILAKKGVNGVLDEIALLERDYARRVYLIALTDAAHLDAAGVLPVLQRVGRMTSNYDRRQVLTHIASRITLDQPAASAYVQAMATMTSDYDKRQALGALIDSGAAAPDSDGVFSAVARIHSSYDKRIVLTEILNESRFDTSAKQGFLRSAATIQADYDRRLVLAAFAGRYRVEADTSDAFFTAVRSIRSNYDRRRVLSEFAVRKPVDPAALQAAIDVTASMTSDYDRAEVLLVLLGGQTLTPASRQAFVDAADRIHSSHDQDRVLAALVRSERR